MSILGKLAAQFAPEVAKANLPAITHAGIQPVMPRNPDIIYLPQTNWLDRVVDTYYNIYGEDTMLPDDFIDEVLLQQNYDINAAVKLMHDAEIALHGTPEQQVEWKRLEEDARIIAEYEEIHRNTIEHLEEEDNTNIDEPNFGDYVASNARDEALKFTFEPISKDTFELDPSQEAAIIGLAPERRGCLIGAAGTGKTTITKKLVNTLMFGEPKWGIEPLRLEAVDVKKYHQKVREANAKKNKKPTDDIEGTIIPSIAMVAYTGQATQVLKKALPKSWAKNVMTIHLLLGYVPEDYIELSSGKTKFRFVPTYTKVNKMPWDIILIDEASMVSVDLWHKLLDASKPGCRFYAVGDLNQLPPPIGTGILGFALSKWPVFELTHVHRQADDTENRIIDTAHLILNGKTPVFDDDKKSGWRVAGYELPNDAGKAQEKILQITRALAMNRMGPGLDFFYNPFRDRIMVPMNGANPQSVDFPIGQLQLNEQLALIFADKGNERYIIDAKRMIKKFAIGYRIMATKNESPAMEDRVTNGMTGRIIFIEDNPEWTGDRRLVGAESQVKANRVKILQDMTDRSEREAGLADAGKALDSFTFTIGNDAAKTQEEERQGGPSSHVITIQFDNGALRTYRNNAQIESIYLAYASTVHKAQGAEMPMAIIVIHHLHKRMLTRELFYTAVTRASQRVLVMYTKAGMNIALRTQKISGSTLKEKLVQYQQMLGEVSGGGRNNGKFTDIRLDHSQEDIDFFDAIDDDEDDETKENEE